MSSPEVVRLKNSVNESDRVLGGPGAPVTLLEYGDFQCIHCGQAYPVIKQVKQLLQDNLRVVFRHFPIVATHPLALGAAEAAEAARAQGKFWQMFDELFTHQKALEYPQLTRYAARIGLDIARFERELTEHTWLKQIEMEYNRAIYDEHVTGTPTFYIDEVRYTGAVDVDSLLLAIKAADSGERIELPPHTRRIKKLFRRFSR